MTFQLYELKINLCLLVIFQKIQQFFDTMPTLKHKIEITNPNTNVTSTITLSGMNDFF